MSVFVPAMLPSNSTVINNASLTRTAAIISYGLLYMGSNSRSQIDKMMIDFDNAKFSDSDLENANNECFLVGCGFSVGFVVLGGHINDVSSLLLKRFLSYTKGPAAIVTSLGAVIAMGLIGMKTEDAKIAETLSPPINEFLLDYVKPELLMVKTISRNIILWNKITPTMAWVNEQIPKFILKAVKSSTVVPSRLPNNEHVLHCYFHILAGVCFSIGLKFAGSCNQLAHDTISTVMDIISPASIPSGIKVLIKSIEIFVC